LPVLWLVRLQLLARAAYPESALGDVMHGLERPRLSSGQHISAQKMRQRFETVE
jgi:hypothetical protein